MKDEISFEKLLKQLDIYGWGNGYQKLRKLHETLENQQVFLFAEPATVNQASKMTSVLLKQDQTLIRLENIAKENGIEIGKTHK